MRNEELISILLRDNTDKRKEGSVREAEMVPDLDVGGERKVSCPLTHCYKKWLHSGGAFAKSLAKGFHPFINVRMLEPASGFKSWCIDSSVVETKLLSQTFKM